MSISRQPCHCISPCMCMYTSNADILSQETSTTTWGCHYVQSVFPVIFSRCCRLGLPFSTHHMALLFPYSHFNSTSCPKRETVIHRRLSSRSWIVSVAVVVRLFASVAPLHPHDQSTHLSPSRAWRRRRSAKSPHSPSVRVAPFPPLQTWYFRNWIALNAPVRRSPAVEPSISPSWSQKTPAIPASAPDGCRTRAWPPGSPRRG